MRRPAHGFKSAWQPVYRLPDRLTLLHDSQFFRQLHGLSLHQAPFAYHEDVAKHEDSDAAMARPTTVTAYASVRARVSGTTASSSK